LYVLYVPMYILDSGMIEKSTPYTIVSISSVSQVCFYDLDLPEIDKAQPLFINRGEDPLCVQEIT